MAGLGDMKGLGSALPDRGGGKKKADPEADGDDDEDDPDVRAPPPTDLSETFSTRARRRARVRARVTPPRADLHVASPPLPRTTRVGAESPDRAAFPLAHDLPPLSLSPVDSSPTASTRRR